MMLLVDVGNTRIKWMTCHQGGTWDRGALIHTDLEPRLATERCWGDLPPPSRMIVANVAGPAMAEALTHWARSAWALEVQLARSQAKGFGVISAYSNPQRMGVDRWVALVGARSLTQKRRG